jgi:hypothetical protein
MRASRSYGASASVSPVRLVTIATSRRRMSPRSLFRWMTLLFWPLCRRTPSTGLATTSPQTRSSAAWPALAGHQSLLPPTHHEERGNIKEAVGYGITTLAFLGRVKVHGHGSAPPTVQCEQPIGPSPNRVGPTTIGDRAVRRSVSRCRPCAQTPTETFLRAPHWFRASVALHPRIRVRQQVVIE